jgi:hypothetical protein
MIAGPVSRLRAHTDDALLVAEYDGRSSAP